MFNLIEIRIKNSIYLYFLIKKSEAELVEQSMRTQIVLELIKSEINYMRSLEIIQKYYARPLKACLDSGKKLQYIFLNF